MSLLVVLLVLISANGLSQQSSDCPTKKVTCTKTKDLLLDSKGCPVRLTSEEMMRHAIAKTPINRPGMLGKNRVYGNVEVEVVVDKQGRVKCVRALNGHALAQGVVVLAVSKWRFEPYTVDARKKAVVGVLSIPFDFSR